MNCKHLSKNNFPNSFFNTKVSKHDCRFRNATFFLEIGRKGEEESKGVCGILIVKKTYKTLIKGYDVVVCFPWAKIEGIT